VSERKFKRGTVVPGFLHPNEASMCWALSWQELVLHDAMRNQRIIREGGTYLQKLAGAGGIGDGRNEVAKNFLDATDGEWLWFVDTDMGFALTRWTAWSPLRPRVSGRSWAVCVSP
jgi:hypothetical protein